MNKIKYEEIMVDTININKQNKKWHVKNDNNISTMMMTTIE